MLGNCGDRIHAQVGGSDSGTSTATAMLDPLPKISIHNHPQTVTLSWDPQPAPTEILTSVHWSAAGNLVGAVVAADKDFISVRDAGALGELVRFEVPKRSGMAFFTPRLAPLPSRRNGVHLDGAYTDSQTILLRSFFRRLSDRCKQLPGGKPVAFLPFFSGLSTPEATGSFLRKLLEGSGLDILLLQDGVGARGWDAEVADRVAPCFRAVASACFTTGTAFDIAPTNSAAFVSASSGRIRSSPSLSVLPVLMAQEKVSAAASGVALPASAHAVLGAKSPAAFRFWATSRAPE